MILLLFQICLAWQSPPATEHFIETVQVENHQAVAAELIIAQAGLKENSLISEDELRRAIRRIEQLPFVLSARFSLKKGSERGKYRLLIHIEETSKFFGEVTVTRNYSDLDNGTNDQSRLGYRHFFGKASMVYASIFPGPQSDGFELNETFTFGYSNFNLLNRGILFTAELDWKPSDTRTIGSTVMNQDDFLSFSVASKLPLSRSQWLNVALFTREGGQETSTSFEGFNFSRVFEQEIFGTEISWEDNTTDDAFLPTSGRLFLAGLSWTDLDYFERDLSNEIPSVPIETNTETIRWFAEANWFFGDDSRHTWPVKANLFFQERDLTDSSFEGLTDKLTFYGLSAGYQHRLSLWKRGQAHDDFFIGANGFISYQKSDRGAFGPPPFSTDETTRYGAEAFLAYRGKWGLARISINYTDTDDDFPSIQ